MSELLIEQQIPAEDALSQPCPSVRGQRLLWWAVSAVFLLFIFVTLTCAWLSDDAYITFRTVDNFHQGYGLRWNIAERVQAYTHPLWMMVLAAGRALTGELYFTTLALSLALSGITAWLLAYRLAACPAQALLALALLTLSRAFVDFSTSGLENPLTHFLLVLFLIRALSPAPPTSRHLFQLGLLGALCMLNRLDLALLVAPPLALQILRARSWPSTAACTAGFLPLLLWEIFSLIYYGFPFPNTAYAKLGTGLSSAALARQAQDYFLWSVHYDIVTLVGLALGLLAVLTYPRSERTIALAPAIGVVLYLIYIVGIGGDFMGGRFLAAPLLVSAGLLACTPAILRPPQTAVLLFLILSASLSTPPPTFLAGREKESVSEGFAGILNERLYYYHGTGLLHAWRTGAPVADRLRSIKRAQEYWVQGKNVVSGEVAIGFFGFYSAPELHIIDPLALSDPLLSRLPAKPGSWRVGHYPRAIPEGYLESVESGTNKITDPALADFYARLTLVTRGPLWSRDRWREIWRFNTGQNDDLLRTYLRP